RERSRNSNPAPGNGVRAPADDPQPLQSILEKKRQRPRAPEPRFEHVNEDGGAEAKKRNKQRKVPRRDKRGSVDSEQRQHRCPPHRVSSPLVPAALGRAQRFVELEELVHGQEPRYGTEAERERRLPVCTRGVQQQGTEDPDRAA